MKRFWPYLILFLLSILLYFPIFYGKIPFPGDTLIGGYYPWRNINWDGRAEYPVKNMTISDAASLLYPSRYIAVKQLKEGQWPLWNNFQFSGAPLLANPLTAAFYPLNIVFWLTSFNYGWGILVWSQTFLAGAIFFAFLRNSKYSVVASLLGAICFSYGSYFANFSELNAPGHAMLWIPLALLSVDKIITKRKYWFFVLVASIVLSLLAGFPQFSLYGLILIGIYTIFRVKAESKSFKELMIVAFAIILSLAICAVQLIPFFEAVSLSARNYSFANFQELSRFFLPLRQLAMFFAPDYFGNPATGNYQGSINYYEYCGYIGVVSLIFVIYSLAFRSKNKEKFFWGGIILASLTLAIRNPLSELPYQLGIPFWRSLIPARFLFFTHISLSVLAAFGLNQFGQDISDKKKIFKRFSASILTIVLIIGLLGMASVIGRNPVSLRNLVLPTLYILVISILFFLGFVKRWISLRLIIFAALIIVCFDLFRQFRKFNTFISADLIYPRTATTEFLKSNLGNHRFLPLHQEIFGTNHQVVYGLEGVEGFDPMPAADYAAFVYGSQEDESVGCWESKYERTVYGRHYWSNILNLLSVKYFLSIVPIVSKDYSEVFREGRLIVYENKQAFPRAYLTCSWEKYEDKCEVLKKLSGREISYPKAYVENDINVACHNNGQDAVRIINYGAGYMTAETNAVDQKLLATSDIYYSGWKVYVDDRQEKLLKINLIMRGVVVPAGEHIVRYIYDPPSFRIGLYISAGALIACLFVLIINLSRRK